MSTTYHIRPPVPGAAPIFPANATAAIISETRLQFSDQRKAYQVYYAVDATLKRQLLSATDERFVMSLRHRTHGFALIRTRTIIEHLMASYGTISSEDLAANDARMQTPWNVTTPIELLYAQIDDGAAYAIDGNSAYTDKQLVMYAYNIITANPIMTMGCRDWRLLDDADKTWTKLKTHFKAAHVDIRTTSTTSTAGFQGRANHTAAEPTSDNPPPTHEHDDIGTTQAYLANLAEAAIANNAQVTALTNTIAQLQQQLTAATTAINAIQHHQTNTQRSQFRGNNRNTGGSNSGQPNGNNNRGNNSGNNGHNDRANLPQRYCWTHGGRVAASHTSQTCSTPNDGHQRNATFANRMGGSDLYCRETGSG